MAIAAIAVVVLTIGVGRPPVLALVLALNCCWTAALIVALLGALVSLP